MTAPMTSEVAVQLIRHTLAAHARFGVRRTVIDDDGKRYTETKVARVEAIDDHVLTIIEVPHQSGRRFEVFLSPSDATAGEAVPVTVDPDFRLFAVSVRYDSTDLLLRRDCQESCVRGRLRHHA